MTEADLHIWIQKGGLADAWRVALENESEPREELYTLEKASGLLVKGGWKVKIIQAKDFDKSESEWIDFELPKEPIAQSKIAVRKTASQKSFLLFLFKRYLFLPAIIIVIAAILAAVVMDPADRYSTSTPIIPSIKQQKELRPN